ncbi:MAG: hypothetical protein ACP5IX_02075 [Patescibacteria group bacterium]
MKKKSISFEEDYRSIEEKIEKLQKKLMAKLRRKIHDTLIQMVGKEIEIYGPQLFGDTGCLRGKIVAVDKSTVTIECNGLMWGRCTIYLEEIEEIGLL